MMALTTGYDGTHNRM